MRALLQKVQYAKVVVGGSLIGEIEHGIMVLLGITHEDDAADMDWLIKKITQLRIFEDEDGKMNLNVMDRKGGIMIISQFTLYGNSKKGNRPSFIRSAPPDISVPLYEQFVEKLRLAFDGPVATGEFGAMMEVSLLNDGPVTIMLDSRQKDF